MRDLPSSSARAGASASGPSPTSPTGPRQAPDPAPRPPERNPCRSRGQLPQRVLPAPRPSRGRAGDLAPVRTRPAARRPAPAPARAGGGPECGPMPPRLGSRAAAARRRTATASAARRGSCAACRATPRAARWRSRCARAAPPPGAPGSPSYAPAAGSPGWCWSAIAAGSPAPASARQPSRPEPDRPARGPSHRQHKMPQHCDLSATDTVSACRSFQSINLQVRPSSRHRPERGRIHVLLCMILDSRIISRDGGCGVVWLERRARRGPRSPAPSDLGTPASALRPHRPSPSPALSGSPRAAAPPRRRLLLLHSSRSRRALHVRPPPAIGPQGVARVEVPPAGAGRVDQRQQQLPVAATTPAALAADRGSQQLGQTEEPGQPRHPAEPGQWASQTP